MEYNRLRLGKSLEHKHQDGREYDDCGDNCEANPVPSAQIVPKAREVHFEIPTDLMITDNCARDREKLTRVLHGHTQIRAAEFGQNSCVYCHDLAV